MLRFKHFLMETALTASGERGERHFRDYIHDFLPGNSKHNIETHQLEKPYKGYSAETKLTILGHHKNENGKHHVYARIEKTGEHLSIPLSRITKFGKGQREYNDEHAFVNTWNHFVASKNQNFDLEHMKREIQAAKKDPSHELSFEKVSAEGFKGRTKEETYRNSYYNELDRAIHTLHDVANHPDFAQNVMDRHIARVTGSDVNVLRPEWEKHHTGKRKNKTSKTDIVIGEGTKHVKKISYKKGGGSQLFSGQAGEFGAATMTTLDEMLKDGKIDRGQHNAARTHLESLQHEMNNRQDISIATRHLKNLFSVHPSLENKIMFEVTSGNNKIGEENTGSASHIIKSHDFDKNKTEIIKLDDPDQVAEKIVKRSFYVSKGTHPGLPLTVRANGK